jgi:hypothetical protein
LVLLKKECMEAHGMEPAWLLERGRKDRDSNGV